MRKDGLCAHPRVREGITLQPEPQHPRGHEGITLSLMGTPRCDVEPRSAEGEAPIRTPMKHRTSGRSPARYRENVHRPELKMKSRWSPGGAPVEPRWSPGGAPVEPRWSPAPQAWFSSFLVKLFIFILIFFLITLHKK
ncbi:hypothetical protein EYF80_060899 [Liparis tanakae]|uniref:Uncharacterized protein n=1 Tax=Liparis tanakae TaxID=230148 RepID=A0A4Z2EKH3_9TELE|nr:hypothetical protein EYF80_060899 [Liparis tanakae]